MTSQANDSTILLSTSRPLEFFVLVFLKVIQDNAKVNAIKLNRLFLFTKLLQKNKVYNIGKGAALKVILELRCTLTSSVS